MEKQTEIITKTISRGLKGIATLRRKRNSSEENSIREGKV